MDVWETIRIRCRRNGEKIKTVARDLGLAPNTVRRYLRKDSPPKRKPRPDVKSLARYQSHIDNLLLSTPKITAARVGSFLRQNVDADIVTDERTLRRYVAGRRAILVPREAFIRAAYAPGDQSQFDFSPMSVRLAGVVVVIQLFVLRLSYSGRFMARASMRCDHPALFAGLLAGFTAFGGVTRSSIFDNASTAVTKILRGRDREQNAKFAEFRGGLSLNVEFAAPAKGNEKGGVEGTHGFIEDNFFRPIPDYRDFDHLNAALAAFCDGNLTRIIAPNTESIGERFAREQLLLQALPSVLPRACANAYAKINKFSEVCFERNWYSVPSQYALRDAVIEAYDERLRIIVRDEVVAQHLRGFGVNERYLDVTHYVGLLQQKHRAAETALVLADGRIPQVFHDLFARYREDNNGSATRRWTQVLALLADTSVDELAQTITHALALGTDDPSAIELLLRQRSLPSASADLDKGKLPMSAQLNLPTLDLNMYATAQLMEIIT
jgi:transposase